MSEKACLSTPVCFTPVDSNIMTPETSTEILHITLHAGMRHTLHTPLRFEPLQLLPSFFKLGLHDVIGLQAMGGTE